MNKKNRKVIAMLNCNWRKERTVQLKMKDNYQKIVILLKRRMRKKNKKFNKNSHNSNMNKRIQKMMRKLKYKKTMKIQ